MYYQVTKAKKKEYQEIEKPHAKKRKVTDTKSHDLSYSMHRQLSTQRITSPQVTNHNIDNGTVNNGFYATKSSIETIDYVAKRQPYIDSISPSPISVVSCNAILNALANANKNYLGDRINDKNNLTNTELLSKQMLTQMIESSAYMKPNVYSFNAQTSETIVEDAFLKKGDFLQQYNSSE